MHTIFIKNHNLLILIFLVKKMFTKQRIMPFSGPIRSDTECYNMQKESVEYVFCRFYHY